jgi:hypothetical protein
MSGPGIETKASGEEGKVSGKEPFEQLRYLLFKTSTLSSFFKNLTFCGTIVP